MYIRIHGPFVSSKYTNPFPLHTVSNHLKVYMYMYIQIQHVLCTIILCSLPTQISDQKRIGLFVSDGSSQTDESHIVEVKQVSNVIEVVLQVSPRGCMYTLHTTSTLILLQLALIFT